MHLLWRLRNGEGPKGLNSKIVTAMIGTNEMIYLTFLYPVRLWLALLPLLLLPRKVACWRCCP